MRKLLKKYMHGHAGFVANTTEKEHRDIEDKNKKRNKNSIFMPIRKI